MESRYNPFYWLALSLIYVYRYTISPFLPPRCRFTPTCSSYALDAIKSFGLLKGSWLSINRLLKCHPFNKGGFDPIPPKSNNKR